MSVKQLAGAMHSLVGARLEGSMNIPTKCVLDFSGMLDRAKVVAVA